VDEAMLNGNFCYGHEATMLNGIIPFQRSANHQNMPSLPKIESEEELLQFLRAEFAYCGCGYYQEAIRDLRDLLELARRRQDALGGESDRFHAVTNELNDWLLRAPGLSTWFA
jgi:hypothetical protein